MIVTLQTSGLSQSFKFYHIFKITKGDLFKAILAIPTASAGSEAILSAHFITSTSRFFPKNLIYQPHTFSFTSIKLFNLSGLFKVSVYIPAFSSTVIVSYLMIKPRRGYL